VLLTDADLDHTLGLFLLREGDSPVVVHASRAIRDALDEGLLLSQVLRPYCDISWLETALEFMPLACRDRSASGLEYKTIPLAGSGPRYRRNGRGAGRLAYVIRASGATGGMVVVAPAVAALEPALLAEMEQAEVILLDGTLWSSDDFKTSGVQRGDVEELVQNHLPILSGSLQTLSALPAGHKVYIHLNNTNPVLWTEGSERKRLDSLNVLVGADGMEFEL
jgi:pyrroloquinoline quinone biosynthesis protein B